MIKNNRNAISPIYLIISIIRRCIVYLIRFFSLLLNINDSLSYFSLLSLSLYIFSNEGEKMMREYRTWYRNRKRNREGSFLLLYTPMKEITTTSTTNFKWYNTGTQGHRSSFPSLWSLFYTHRRGKKQANRRGL